MWLNCGAIRNQATWKSSAVLIGLGQSRGYVTLDEIGLALAPVMHDPEAYAVRGDDLFRCLDSANVEVLDLDEAEEVAEVNVGPASKYRAVRSASDLEQVPVDDGVGMYFAEIGQVPLLRREEELALALKIEDGRAAAEALLQDGLTLCEVESLRATVRCGVDARDRLIRANTRLVVSVAKRYQEMGLPLLDLVQAGNMGLIRAADKYDYRRGTKFSTLATWWIRQAVSRAVASHGRTIRLPIHMGAQLRKARRAQETLGQILGRDPTPEEIAGSMGTLSPERVRWMFRASRRPLSLERPIGEDGDSEMGSLIEDTTSPSPSDTTEHELLRGEVTKMLEELPPREVNVLRMRFGLDGRPPLTLKEIGDRMGVTRERARQIVAQALRRLRHPSRSRDLLKYLK